MMNIDSFSHYLCWRQFQLHFLPPLHLLLRWDYPRSSIINMSDLQSPDFSVHTSIYLWMEISLDIFVWKVSWKNYQNKRYSFSAVHPTRTNRFTYTTVAHTSTTYFVKWCFYLLKADRCQGPLLTLCLPISIHQNILLIWLSISGIHYFLHLFCHYGGWSHYFLAILLQGAPNWIYLSCPTYFC